MTLREYLYTHHMTIEEFACLIQFNKDYVSRVMKGVFRPSERFGFQVEIATKGKIKYEDMFDKKPERLVKNLVKQ